jgi:hypothetical protein
MQGDDDQIVPYKGAALLQAKLLKNATLTGCGKRGWHVISIYEGMHWNNNFAR